MPSHDSSRDFASMSVALIVDFASEAVVIDFVSIAFVSVTFVSVAFLSFVVGINFDWNAFSTSSESIRVDLQLHIGFNRCVT